MYYSCALCMADRTGLEPATSGVTGRHSNQLSYTPVLDRLIKIRPPVNEVARH